jgi:hypothetical protein
MYWHAGIGIYTRDLGIEITFTRKMPLYIQISGRGTQTQILKLHRCLTGFPPIMFSYIPENCVNGNLMASSALEPSSYKIQYETSNLTCHNTSFLLREEVE